MHSLLEFTEDDFLSPSAAATVVAAGNRNGPLPWTTEAGGETYAEWPDAQLAVAVGTGVDDGLQ